MNAVKQQLHKRMAPAGAMTQGPGGSLPPMGGGAIGPVTPESKPGLPTPEPSRVAPGLGGGGPIGPAKPVPGPTERTANPTAPAYQTNTETQGGTAAPAYSSPGAPQLAAPAQAPATGNSEAVSNPRGWFLNIAAKHAPGGRISQEGMQALANDPEFQQAGWRLGNPNASGIIDSVIGPQGQVVDVSKNSLAGGGTGELYWGAYGPSAGNWAEGGGGGAAGGAGAPGGGAGGPSAAGTFQSQIRQMLMERLQRLQGGPDPNDPAIKAQMDAARLESDRSHEQGRVELAERLAADGGGAMDTGALTRGVQQSRERQGANLAGIKGQLMAREFQAQRQEMQQMLAMAMEAGDADATRELQLRLAEMDNEIRRLGISEQGRMFDDEFGRRLGRDQEDDFRWRYETGF